MVKRLHVWYHEYLKEVGPIFRIDKKMLRSADWLLLILSLGLCVFGLIAIANARSTPYQGTESGFFAILGSVETYYVGLQAMWVGLGIALLAVVAVFDYHLLGDLWFYIYIGNLALLTLVLVLSEGIAGINAFLSIGATMRTIQPAEFCKIAMIVTLAKLFTRREQPVSKIRELLPILGYFALPLGIVVLQGEVGSVMVYMAIFLGIFFLSGTNWKLIVGTGTVGVLSLVPLWFLIGEMRQQRIVSFLFPNTVDSDATLQVDRARDAIGSGMTGGKGLFSQGSFGQLNYVPLDHSDFIFSVTAEAIGFWGCLLLVGVYIVVILHLFLRSARTGDRFGAMIIAGVAAMFLFQTFQNIAMTVGIMPVTGIPLPFISYGGSAMLTNLIAVGLVISISMRPQKSYALSTR